MASLYFVRLINDTGVIRCVRRPSLSGVQPSFTVKEAIAYRFPSEVEAKQLAGKYEGTAWTPEVVRWTGEAPGSTQPPREIIAGDRKKTVRSRPLMTTAEWIEKARTYHGDRYDYREAVYHGASKRIKVICPKHGPWWVVPSQHASPSAHHGCRQCARLISDEEWLRRFRDRHGDKYVYSRCVFRDANTPVEIICKEHGSFYAAPVRHGSAGGGGRCPDCRRLDSRAKFLERAKAAHGDRYDYSLVDYRTIDDKVEIICKAHGSFWQTPHNHESGHGCGKCVGRGGPQCR